MRLRSAVLALPLLLALGSAPAVDASWTKPLSHVALRPSLPHVLPDDLLQLERGLGRWPEAEQFSPANNAVIHRVVTEVVARRRFSRR